MHAPTLPGLFPEATRRAPRPELAGFCRDDQVEIATLKAPGEFRRGRVVAVLTRMKVVYVRVQGENTLLDVNPIMHPHLLRKRRVAS